ncbi:MAG: restriction endonuclease subunit S [Lactobacillus panisapium]
MNNAKKTLVPHRRFKEFQNTGAWEQHKLGEFGKVAMNKRIFKYQTSKDGEIPFYKIGTFGKKADSYISRNLFEKYKFKYPYPHKGDLLISASGSIGRIIEYKGQDEYFQDSNIVWLDHDIRLDNSFLKQFYNIVRWHGLEGSTIKRLYNKNILETDIKVPEVAEQKRIGLFFQHLDSLITLHQRKLTKLKKLKSAYLTEMFPAEGERKPKRRFAGFTDDWEQRKLGDVVAKLSKKEKSSSGLPAVEYDDVIARDGILNKNIENKPHGKIGTYFDRETVLFGKLRPYLKNWLNPQFNGVAVGDWWVLKPNDLLNVNFLYCLIQTKHFMNIANQTTGTKMPRSDWNLVSNTKFFIPRSLQEQNKIAENLANLQNVITLHQRKIDKLKKLKDAYLNEMFV